MALACVCAVALVLSRRRLSGWLQPILLLFTCLGLSRGASMGAARLFLFERADDAGVIVGTLYYVAFFVAGVLPFLQDAFVR
jgi:hypothetical protein